MHLNKRFDLQCVPKNAAATQIQSLVSQHGDEHSVPVLFSTFFSGIIPGINILNNEINTLSQHKIEIV